MKKLICRRYSLFTKAVCMTLALVVVSSLFAAGLWAFDRCGLDRCCCHPNRSAGAHPAMENQIQAPMDCCSDKEQSACTLQSKTPFELPVATTGSGMKTPLQLFVFNDASTGLTGFFPVAESHFERCAPTLHFRSPPLFLSKQSFLI